MNLEHIKSNFIAEKSKVLQNFALISLGQENVYYLFQFCELGPLKNSAFYIIESTYFTS